MNDIPIHSGINPAQHPNSISGESQGAKSARVALGALYIAAGKIADLNDVVKGKALLHQRQVMASMPKPPDGKPKIAPALIYDQQAADHVINAGTPLAQKALQAADTALTSLGETVTRLDSAINLKVLAGKTSRGQELRAYAASQKHPFQKLGGLFQHAHENAALVAAVLEAEPYLSNLSEENQQHLRTVAANVMAPAEVSDRKEASLALDHLTGQAKAFTESTASIFNGLQSPTAGAIEAITQRGDDNG
ncbi:MAG: hypothetical protein V3U93_03475 [Alphaproteobacteria bacterium]